MKATKRDRTYLQSFNRAFNNIGKHRKTGSWDELMLCIDGKDVEYTYRPSIDPGKITGFSGEIQPSVNYGQFQKHLLREMSMFTGIPISILTAPYASKWKMGWFERMSEEVEC